MHDLEIAVYHVPLKLSKPYALSFATIEFFSSFFVVITRNGASGVGEITPLPGYSDETPESVRAALTTVAAACQAGASFTDSISQVAKTAPFVASGLATAVATLDGDWFGRTPGPIPLTALCGAATPEEAALEAKEWAAKGWSCIKLKIGAGLVADDIARVRAVCSAVPSGTEIRLDANQALSFEQARVLAEGLAGWPVTLVEQPFGIDAWELNRALVPYLTMPLMLDESIWTLGDIEHAKEVGAGLVKLKLCKHPGPDGVRELARAARQLDLGLVFGNGVQSAVGNHVEMVLHAELNIASASEGNGFMKVADAFPAHGLSVERGCARSTGIPGIAGQITRKAPPILAFTAQTVCC